MIKHRMNKQKMIKLICELVFIGGKSKRWIYEHHGIHRDTTTKYSKAFMSFLGDDYKKNRSKKEWESKITKFLKKPELNKEARSKRKLTQDMVEYIISEWESYKGDLEEGKPAKRTVLYKRLAELNEKKGGLLGEETIDFNVCYSTFCVVIRNYEEGRIG